MSTHFLYLQVVASVVYMLILGILYEGLVCKGFSGKELQTNSSLPHCQWAK